MGTIQTNFPCQLCASRCSYVYLGLKVQFYTFFSHLKLKSVFLVVTFPVLSANTCEISDKLSYPPLV